MTGLDILLWFTGVVVVFGSLFYVVIIYNGLIRIRKNIDRAWANIEVILKQRHDELPKLIDTVKEYMGYEKSVLKEITEARTRSEQAKGPREEAEADSILKGALGNLFAVAENYPDLKSSERFQQLQNRISALEEQIADRREFYNSSVTIFNIRIHQIPYNLIANLLKYKDKELFKVSEEEKKDIDISKEFSK